MDAAKYIKMIQDKHFRDLEKMGYKYSKTDVQEMLEILKETGLRELPLSNMKGNSSLVIVEGKVSYANEAVKALMSYKGDASYGFQSLENEIISTLAIELIDTSRDSVRRIMAGNAPSGKSEYQIWGMKQGFEFIADPENQISAESMRKLYEIAVNSYHEKEENRLKTDQMYRDDNVEVFNYAKQKTIHRGLDPGKLNQFMDDLFEFINRKDKLDDLSKAAAIHFYIAYLHPYFDGNGRIARMTHLWFLLQKGYSATLFLPFSSLIHRSKKEYNEAFELVEKNEKISGFLDITPFLQYFETHVYQKIGESRLESDALDRFTGLLKEGKITEKEKALFHFVVSRYGKGEFSTKQLEKDFGNCAYATIRSFVLKMKEEGILEVHVYGNRNKYCIKAPEVAAY